MNHYIIIDPEADERMTWRDWLICGCIAAAAVYMILAVIAVAFSL